MNRGKVCRWVRDRESMQCIWRIINGGDGRRRLIIREVKNKRRDGCSGSRVLGPDYCPGNKREDGTGEERGAGRKTR